MRFKPKTVAEYMSSVPAPQRAALGKLRRAIKSAAPGAEEGISYGMLAYKFAGKPIAYFGAFKGHCTLFTAGYVRSLLSALPELAEFDLAPSGIHFTHENPLPDALVRKIVREKIRLNFQSQKTA